MVCCDDEKSFELITLFVSFVNPFALSCNPLVKPSTELTFSMLFSKLLVFLSWYFLNLIP